MKQISLLLGSGFSQPAGYPTTTQLNERLRKVDASEICVHTSGEAFFLNGQLDPNAWFMGVEERRLVQELLEFYNNRVLQEGEQFHYETYYDYCISPQESESYPEELREFLEGFKERYKVIVNIYNMLMRFIDNFSQLVAHLLSKPLEIVHHGKPYHPNYNAFLLLLEELSKTHRVHIHTLNHDLYLENLSFSDSIQGRLADGFDELSSPIYATKEEDYAIYTVRLRRFTNKYDDPFCLYKLHGSIDNYWVTFDNESYLVKLPWGVSRHRIKMQVVGSGKHDYVNSSAWVVPDFLSGTTHKVSRYPRGSYYPVVLNHFLTNLKQSNVLVVIGYGFADLRINQYLKEYFLDDPTKIMFVVDVVRPATEFLQRENVHFIEGGVSNMDKEFILQISNSRYDEAHRRRDSLDCRPGLFPEK